MDQNRPVSTYHRFLEHLADEDVGRACRHEPLCNHSTWRIGGPADLLVEPVRVEQVSRVLRRGAEADTPVVVMGDGSNLLFNDAGVRGVVMKISRGMSSFTIEGTRIRAQAGVAVPELAQAAGEAGLAGLEHTVGIPGTLGGLILMNGGSQRHCISDVIRKVGVMDRQGQVSAMSPQACQFSYRRSIFQTGEFVILAAELECERGDRGEIESCMLEVLRERARKFPLNTANCGSVFVNHPQMYQALGPPGEVIEDAGLKGLRVGDAQLSQKHANFIINLGAAKAADVLEVIRRVRRAVYERTGFRLDCEVRFVCPDGRVVLAHQAL